MIRHRPCRTAWSLGAAALCLMLAGPAGAGEELNESSGPAREGTSTPKRQIPPAEERAQRLTDRLKEELGLTADQVPKVAAINLRAARRIEATTGSGGGRRGRLGEMRSAQQERDKELKEVLTEEQWKRYEAIREDMRAETRSRAGNLRGQRGGWRPPY